MDVTTLFGHAFSAHQAGDIPTAKVGYKKILCINPLHFDALHLLGVCYFNEKKLEQSKHYIKRALLVNRKFAEAHFNLGNTLLALDDFIEAKKCYEIAINLKPGYIDAYTNLGCLLRHLGELKEAENIYEKALKLNPNAQLYYNYGNILSDQKLHDKALEVYQIGITLDPKGFSIWDAIGSLFANQGLYKEAIPYYQKALTIEPEFSSGHSNISGVLIEMGLIEEGLYHAKVAVDLNPNNLFALSNLGAAQITSGKFNEAAISLQKALQIDPRLLKCNAALGRLECLLGNWEGGIKWYNTSYTLDPENQGLEDGVYLAVLAYLINDYASGNRYIESTKTVQNSTLPIHKAAKGYWFLLNNLLLHHQSKATFTHSTLIYVVGESHSLSYSNNEVMHLGQMKQCKSLWIPGCKQWHLGNKHLNQYKSAVMQHFKSLTKNSTVLMVIGEIDCRPDEGIAKFVHNNPSHSIDTVIHKTITAYLDWLTQINIDTGHQIIISGVPASNIDLKNLEIISKEAFLNLIRVFNQVLREESLIRGFEFLDVYAMTANDYGISNGKWHIDEFHLKPTAIPVLFNDFFIKL